MIKFTRLNGSEMYLNPDLIQTVEAKPDTVITLTTGEKLVGVDPPTEIVRQFLKYKTNHSCEFCI